MELSSRAEIRSVNLRKEFHGPDKVLAVDVKFIAKAGPDVLAHFHPRLRGVLFDNGALVMPQLGRFHWEGSMQQMLVTFGGMTFSEVELGQFELQAKANGAPDDEHVEITFRASFTPDGKSVDKLAKMLMEEVDLEVSPQQAPLDLGESK